MARFEVHNQCLQMDHDMLVFVFDEQAWSHLQFGNDISMTLSHKFNAGMPSMRNPVSSDIISASVLLSDTALCFFLSPWKWHKCMRSKYQHNTTWVWFWDSQISCGHRRLGIIKVCSLLLDSKRGNTVCSWMCDECKWWDVRVADRTLSSTFVTDVVK